MLLACCCGSWTTLGKNVEMPVWLQVIMSLAAAVLGGVIAPQLSQTKDRRAARAAVRERIAEVDALRWDDEPYLEFRRALAAFEASAILARVPRGRAVQLVHAAEEVRKASQTYPDGPDGEPITVVVDHEKDEAWTHAIEELGRTLWHPWLARIAIVVGRAGQAHK
jgi:hypothetical protein